MKLKMTNLLICLALSSVKPVLSQRFSAIFVINSSLIAAMFGEFVGHRHTSDCKQRI